MFTGKICILTEPLSNMKQRDYEVSETRASYPSSDQTASENSEQTVSDDDSLCFVLARLVSWENGRS